MKLEENIRVVVINRNEAVLALNLINGFENISEQYMFQLRNDINNNDDDWVGLAIDIDIKNGSCSLVFDYVSDTRLLGFSTQYHLFLYDEFVTYVNFKDLKEDERIQRIEDSSVKKLKPKLSDEYIEFNFKTVGKISVGFDLDGIASDEFKYIKDAINKHERTYVIDNHIIMLDELIDVQLIGVD